MGAGGGRASIRIECGWGSMAKLVGRARPPVGQVIEASVFVKYQIAIEEHRALQAQE